MKRFSLNWIWQWRVDEAYFGLNPIALSFEYELFGPELLFKFVLLGVGFQISFKCPWETQYSQWAKDAEKNCMHILTLGGDLEEAFRRNTQN